MRSFRHQPDNRRAVYLALVGSVEGQLRDAYARRHDSDQETQASLAAKLGVDRSVVHRRLTGRSNMTLETVADMVWGLGHCIQIEIFDPKIQPTNSHVVVPNNKRTIYALNGDTATVVKTGGGITTSGPFKTQGGASS